MNNRKRRTMVRAPTLLNDVMDAIASMRSRRILTVERIIQKVRENAATRKIRPDPKSIIKSLHRGIKLGLIKKKNCKFLLGLNSKDYEAYKFFSRQKKTKNLVKKKVFKQAPLPPFGENVVSSTSYDSATSLEPCDQRKRKSRKRRRKNRRRSRSRSNKRRKHHSTSETGDTSSSSQSGSGSSHSSTPSKKEEKKKEPNKTERKEEDSPTAHCSSSINCDNPNCLCNRVSNYSYEENGAEDL